MKTKNTLDEIKTVIEELSYNKWLIDNGLYKQGQLTKITNEIEKLKKRIKELSKKL